MSILQRPFPIKAIYPSILLFKLHGSWKSQQNMDMIVKFLWVRYLKPTWGCDIVMLQFANCGVRRSGRQGSFEATSPIISFETERCQEKAPIELITRGLALFLVYFNPRVTQSTIEFTMWLVLVWPRLTFDLVTSNEFICLIQNLSSVYD